MSSHNYSIYCIEIIHWRNILYSFPLINYSKRDVFKVCKNRPSVIIHSTSTRIKTSNSFQFQIIPYSLRSCPKEDFWSISIPSPTISPGNESEFNFLNIKIYKSHTRRSRELKFSSQDIFHGILWFWFGK